MVNFVGASSLDNIRLKIQKDGILEKNKIFTARGLSFIQNRKNRAGLKYLPRLLNAGILKGKKDLVIWHDILNNSVSKHRTNNYTPLSIDGLIEILKKYRSRNAAVVYCKRLFAPELGNHLREAGLLVINVKKHLLSKRNFRRKQEDLQQLHPSQKLEFGLFRIVNSKSANLWELISRKGKRGKSVSKYRRKLAQKRRANLQ